MEPMSQLERAKLLGQEERISPREIELIKFRDNQTPLLVKLVTGEAIDGVIAWYDDRAIHVVQGSGGETTVYMQAIAHYKVHS